MARPIRNPKLYNKKIAAAFRSEANKRTRPFSGDRKFLHLVADTLGGKQPPGSDVKAREASVLISLMGMNAAQELIPSICAAIPGISCLETTSYLTIFATNEK